MLQPLFAALLISISHADKVPSRIAETQYGKVQGFTVTADDGFKADIFLGVPFAQPPVGDLRFEKPVPSPPWNFVRVTDKLQEACVGLGTFGPYNMSDDCLYLNIIAPHERKEAYPVLVLIHGGAFVTGSAHMYRDHADVVSSFVSKGVVVVVVQYRLFVNGFASIGAEPLHGNLGLWDQVAALRFVKSTIASFGGNPNDVTVLGYSAGSASVSALSVSPHSRDLFSKAIQMGGSTLAEWASSEQSVSATRELLTALGCQWSNGEEAKQCLKSASNEEIMVTYSKLGYPRRHPNFASFAPRVDGDFFPKPFSELLSDAPVKPTYVGMCEEESMIFTVVPLPAAVSALFIPVEKQATYSADDFASFLDVVVSREVFADKTSEIVNKIREFYLNHDAPAAKNSVFYLRRYTQLCSDLEFVVPILREAVLKTKFNWPVYLYVNNHLSKTHVGKFAFDAVMHSHDHQHIFRGENQFFPVDFTKEDREVSGFLIDSLVSFVKTGDPSTKTVAWPRTSKDHPLRHLRIKHRPEVRDLLFAERLRFWDSLADEYGYDIVQGIAHKTSHFKAEL